MSHKLRIVRRETTRWVYLIGRCGGFRWLPRIDWRPRRNFGSIMWLGWMVDWISKEWIEECDRHGFGFGDELRCSVPAGPSLESPAAAGQDDSNLVKES